MPRFTNKEGLAVETSVPGEAARLRAEGFTEQKARTAAVRETDAARATEAPTQVEAPAPSPKPAK
ncbi:hypothetical protein [Arthrobacter sp. EpRS71]|uniref:hypothetical protein n=1 Tax=Arthrobacter sp. EpRS71 TaxID=1743141 RepID=UPI0007484D3C|nr:hypothetical protein [Arthrobacter sp. EpRS71]KUM34535.1 hypothetical protein AR689_10350 [Arthrobacter sp. EpRS71]